MRRKVIKQAGNAHTITLPIRWVRDNGICGGTELDLIEDGRSVVIRNEKGARIKRAKLDISGFYYKNIYLHLHALYVAGYDEIEVVGDKDMSDFLAKALRSLIGYALVSKDGNKVVLKDVGGGVSGDLDEIFKRVFQAVIQLYENAVFDVFGKGEEKEKCLISRDREINKLCLFLQRSINKMSMGSGVREKGLFSYSFELERIADNVVRFWRENILNRPKKSAKLNELAEVVLGIFEECYDVFYGFNSRGLEKMYSLRKKVRGMKGFLRSEEVLYGYLVGIAESLLDLNPLVLMMGFRSE